MLDDATKTRLLGERESMVRDFERATLAWLSPTAAVDARSVLWERREGLAASLRNGYWKLDPHIRARSIYDRSGMIKAGGLLEFYPNNSRPVKLSAEPSSLSTARRPETHADDVD